MGQINGNGKYKCYPTRCRFCRNEVFYYENEEGSKVFFDDLGPPWPVHQCDEYLEANHRKRQNRISKAPGTKTKPKIKLPWFNNQKKSIRGSIRRIRLDDNALRKLQKDCDSHGIREVHKRINPPLARVSLLESPNSSNERYIFYVNLFDLLDQSVEEGDIVAADLKSINRETWTCESLLKRTW